MSHFVALNWHDVYSLRERDGTADKSEEEEEEAVSMFPLIIH